MIIDDRIGRYMLHTEYTPQEVKELAANEGGIVSLFYRGFKPDWVSLDYVTLRLQLRTIEGYINGLLDVIDKVSYE